MSSMRQRGGGSSSQRPTAALFVRIPTEQARRLDRASFELRRSKQALVSELVERYLDPGSPASLAALGERTVREGNEPSQSCAEGGRRRVTVETVETVEPEGLVVGHHSFRPLELGDRGAGAAEVLRSDQAAELLQVERELVERLAEGGELPGRKLAGEWRFARAALLSWLAEPSPPGGEGKGDANR
jgi:excisionase family DNA binding protein